MQRIAVLAAVLLAVGSAFQILLVAGAPFGHLAWGGRPCMVQTQAIRNTQLAW
jgi:hypothetical protein